MLILILIIFVLSTCLFQKAAGTLNPGKLNIISCVYYIFMLQSFAGTALIMLGFDQHYTLTYLLNKEKSLGITAIVVGGIAIILPLFIILFEKIFLGNIKQKYKRYLSASIKTVKSDMLFVCFSILAAIVLCILIGFLVKIGYIPLVRLFHSPEGFDFALERTRIGKLYFIHPYISNILVLSLIPLLSYISFSYFISLKERKWAIIAGILFVASIIVKTYKFEKTPIVFYLIVYVLILIYFKGGIKKIFMAFMAALMAGIITVFYFATGFTGSLFDIYNGPLGRTLFTEVGTLSYCFDMFPDIFGFLNGRSFTPTILKLIGMESSEHLRSAKLTMAFYGSEKVYDGSAGVMNTLFAGEAYANWGYGGIVVAVIWIALIISLFMGIILRLKKTPATITLFAIFTMKIGIMLEGGFCDFVYNFEMVFTVIVVLGIYICFECNNRIQREISKMWDRLKGRLQECIRKSGKR